MLAGDVQGLIPQGVGGSGLDAGEVRLAQEGLGDGGGSEQEGAEGAEEFGL